MTIQELRTFSGQNTIRRGQQERQLRVDQIDLREADREIAAEHDSVVEHVVDDVQQRAVIGTEDQLRIGRTSAS
jgi:hypothetical protein